MRFITVGLALVLSAPGAVAQSITSGEVIGSVVDEFGVPVAGAHLILTDRSTGTTRDTESGPGGGFQFAFLQSGHYDLIAERLGDQPVRISDIQVDAGARIAVPVTLTTGTPPITELIEIPFASNPPASGQELGDLELSGLPHELGDVAELGRFWSTSSADLATEGLPAQLSGVVVDGVAFAGARHPALPSGHAATAPLAISSIGAAELMANGVDVEYGGFAGATLVTRSRRGTRNLRAGAFGDWIGDALTGSKYFDAGGVSRASLRGGLWAGGPIIRDTAHFAIGVEGRRLQTPYPRSWETTPLDTQLLAVASDSFGVDLNGFTTPRLVESELLSAFGRLDWQFSSATALGLRASTAALRFTNPDLGSRHLSGGETSLDGLDVFAAANLSTLLGQRFGFEVRLGVEWSEREYLAGSLPATSFVEGPAAFGTDPALPGLFRRVAVRAGETFHIRLPSHQIKIGGAATLLSVNQTYVDGTGGSFSFATPDAFGVLDGAFVQSISRSNASYSTTEFGAYLQDKWNAAPGLEITAGLRFDVELLPKGATRDSLGNVTPSREVMLNDEWFERTGLANDVYDRSLLKWSPRFGFEWDVASLGLWVLRGEATMHHGTVDPGTFAELIAYSGDVGVRRGVGALGRWPQAPDSNVAPIVGSSVTLLGPEFQPARTSRASAGLTGLLAPGTFLHLNGVYRHTDFLPRRHDLNVLPAAAGRDQYGREIFGTLVQRGGLLVAEPGSNRRFADFDVVSALDPDGYSDYWGLTARLEHRASDAVTFFASYTFSRTEDNWLSGGGVSPPLQLTPFPDSLNTADWAEGRSDLDVPHRFTLGTELDFGPLVLSAFLRRESGPPFTPGFRDGVDANGDGSPRNDPAYVDADVTGVSDLFGEWPCLQTQVGRFAERNSCRGPALAFLDLRLRLRPVRLGPYPLEIVVDGLNLLDAELADVDRALYLVDPAGSLSVDPVTGDVVVPLAANPNFGRAAVRRSSGRAIRIGARVNYD